VEHRPGGDTGESVHCRLVTGHAAQSACISGGGGSSVASWIVNSYIGSTAASRSFWWRPIRVVERRVAGPDLAESVGNPFGVDEGVRDSLRRGGVLGVGGITDESRARPVRLPEEVGHTSAGKAFRARLALLNRSVHSRGRLIASK
jgi:hypothetical protein